MLKRPKATDTEDDLLRMQEEFLKERQKNPTFQVAAQLVGEPKKSVFAKKRQEVRKDAVQGPKKSRETNLKADVVIGDIIERRHYRPALVTEETNPLGFPEVIKITNNLSHPSKGKSLFALSLEAKGYSGKNDLPPTANHHTGETLSKLEKSCGSGSFIVEDKILGSEIHKENLDLLSKMSEEEILEEQRKLLKSLDPSLIQLLSKKRPPVETSTDKKEICQQPDNLEDPPQEDMEIDYDIQEQGALDDLPTPALPLVQRSQQEKWLNFEVIEKDKLEWMRDIPLQVKKLQPNEQFEARFDWKGVLLPYSPQAEIDNKQFVEKDERELYLHHEEPQRPGYTLQELFRLARSQVMKQRLAAYGAIAGILNIYQQGFYDQVLELPITKIFFLLRYGFDDNALGLLETTAKALANLFYNESDEALLDILHDNPGGHWEPIFGNSTKENSNKNTLNIPKPAQAKVEDTEEDKASMSDFHLAETDLVECMLRTNILQRLYYIFHSVRPNNSTVASCLKILIRMARCGKEVAWQILNHTQLMDCLLANFIPHIESLNEANGTQQQQQQFYNYPQYLCLKMLRVLMAQNLEIAKSLSGRTDLMEKLLNYIAQRGDINGHLIKVQIESLRIVRCLLLLRVDHTLHRSNLSAYRYMLQWHFQHLQYEVEGPYLIRQHASAILAAVTAIEPSRRDYEVDSLLDDILKDCCHKWLHQATRFGVTELSQSTLLSASLNAIRWLLTMHPSASKANDKYLTDFLHSKGFTELVSSLTSTSILLREACSDRSTVHPPLPTVGGIVISRHGPQLIVTQNYPMYLLLSIWRLLELQMEVKQQSVLGNIMRSSVMNALVAYIRALGARTNCELGSSFYAKTEIQFISKLLCCSALSECIENAEMLKIVFNFLGLLTAEQIPQIEALFQNFIFNRAYAPNIEPDTLKKWQEIILEKLVYTNYIIMEPAEMFLSMTVFQKPILKSDWPYFQLRTFLEPYLSTANETLTESSDTGTEREVLQMTFGLTNLLEQRNSLLQIVSPTEKLMYLMMAFMGPQTEFLDRNMHDLLHAQITNFYAQCKDYTFQFDVVYEGQQCQFENLYALFVEHFQAASYGDELFSSLVLIPMAQKYDNKWRRRIWSDYAAALRFLNCDESLLLGGLQAYLEPVETEESLLKAYHMALMTNMLRPGTISYQIAKHHLDRFRENKQ